MCFGKLSIVKCFYTHTREISNLIHRPGTPTLLVVWDWMAHTPCLQRMCVHFYGWHTYGVGQRTLYFLQCESISAA